MKPYQDNQTGVWNGLPEVKTRTEFIECELYDLEGNGYPATVEVHVNDFVVDVVGVNWKKIDDSIELSDPQHDIRETIRKQYKSQDIKF